MKRLTGRDAYGDIVADEEMQIIASRGIFSPQNLQYFVC